MEKAKMKKYQKYLIFLLLICLVLSIYFYFRKKEEFTQRVNIVLMHLLDKRIQQEKKECFAFALALAQSETLQIALERNDTKKAAEVLKRYTSTLEVFSNSNVLAQVVTKDFLILARNWETASNGLNVKASRPDLIDITKTQKPHVSFEAARKLVLIASIPVVKENKTIGFIEIIQKFDSMKNYFANFDIDLLVLMDKKYRKQAILIQKNPQIDNMIVANDNANIHHITYFQGTGLNRLIQNGSMKGENSFYFSKIIFNAKGEHIGFFVLAIPKKKMKLFNAFEEELDTFLTYSRKDLYFATVNQNSSMDFWNDYTPRDLLSLKQSAQPEDKAVIVEKLRKQLNTQSKDQLISLLLDNNTNEKIRGHIK